MKLLALSIRDFRGIQRADIRFGDHDVLCPSIRRLRFPLSSCVCRRMLAPRGGALGGWFDQQRRLAGRTRFEASEIRQEVVRIHRRSRAHRRMWEGGIRVMTVHQAKNREFESVIVLWPYEVSGPADRQRRLLYNALTRAKRRALVIVQGPKRLSGPPFTEEA